jgi:hypothetical protein
MYTYVHTNMYIYICIFIFIYIYKYIYIYIGNDTKLSNKLRKYMGKSTEILVNVQKGRLQKKRTYVHVDIYVNTRIYLYACTSPVYTYVSMHVHVPIDVSTYFVERTSTSLYSSLLSYSSIGLKIFNNLLKLLLRN